VHNFYMAVITTPKLVGIIAGFIFWILALLYFFNSTRRREALTSTILDFYDDNSESTQKKWLEKQESLRREYESLRSEKRIRRRNRTRSQELVVERTLCANPETVEDKCNVEDNRSVEIERAGSAHEQFVQCPLEIVYNQRPDLEPLVQSQHDVIERKSESEEQSSTARKGEVIYRSQPETVYRLCDDFGVTSCDEDSEPINVGSATVSEDGGIVTPMNFGSASAIVTDERGIIASSADLSFPNQPV